MITGETEALIARNLNEDTHYDNFLFFGKKKKHQTPQEKEAKKQRRKAFWKSAEETLQAEGVAESLDRLLGLAKQRPDAKEKTSPNLSDYRFDLKRPDKNKEEGKDEPGQKNSTGTYVVGGAVLVGIAVYAITHFRKLKSLKNANPSP